MNKIFKRFFNLTKYERINWLLKLLISLSGILLSVLHFIDPVTWHKFPSYLVTIILPYAPELLKKLGFTTSTRLQIIYGLFLIIAMVLGIDLDWYKTIIIMGSPSYDKIVHTLSGVVAAFGAKEILDNFYDGKEATDYSGKTLEAKTGSSGKSTIKRKVYHTGFAFLFIICFVAFTAAMWECFEFTYDKLCGGHMQELNAPGIDDTMGDIISATVAGIITAIFLRKK
jgi:hypothetical protein CLOSPO_02225